MSDAVLQATGLVKKYRDKTALSGLTIDIRRGEFFGLLGPNGAGKTTLISLFCGLTSQTSGELHRNGDTIGTFRKKTGFVPQEIALYPTLTAWENLDFFGKMYGLKGSFLRQRIQEGLEQFALADRKNGQIGTFSGGMKRRINLLAATLHQPEVLFLDEPTVGIDVQSRSAIINYLKHLNHNGTTIIYTSHHLDEAEQLCSRIGIIDHGQLVLTGKPAELLESNSCTSLEELFLKLTGHNLRD